MKHVSLMIGERDLNAADGRTFDRIDPFTGEVRAAPPPPPSPTRSRPRTLRPPRSPHGRDGPATRAPSFSKPRTCSTPRARNSPN
jgi:hypothetical protein